MNLLDARRARFVARVGGVLYLAIIAIGAAGEAVVRGRIVVSGDATATAANLRSMEWLWRLGVAGEVVLLTSAVALAMILYVLLRPVSRDLALAAVLFNLICIAVEAVAAVSLAAALFPLRNGSGTRGPRRKLEVHSPGEHQMSGIGTFLTMSAAAAALAAVTSCAPSDTAVRCATSVPQVSAASRTLTAAEAEAIGAGLTMPEIYRRLGPPRRDRCSGLYCPEWDVADGRVLSVRSSSGCGKPIQVSLQ